MLHSLACRKKIITTICCENKSLDSNFTALLALEGTFTQLLSLGLKYFDEMFPFYFSLLHLFYYNLEENIELFPPL